MSPNIEPPCLNNGKKVDGILTIQQRMLDMENTVQKILDMGKKFGPSKPPTNNEAHDSNDDGTTTEISSALIFCLDDV